MSEAASASQAGSPRLRVGALLALLAMAVAGIAGVIAVGSADSDGGAFGVGLGIAVAVFLTGGALATGLACLRRGRAEIAAIAGVFVAGLAIDLVALTAWLHIDGEAYLKVMGIALAWTVFALVVLGLTIAVRTEDDLERPLYFLTCAVAVASGLVVTWLVATASATAPLDALPSQTLTPTTGSTVSQYDIGSGLQGEWLLRALGIGLVLLAALWFATLAASRLEQSRAPVTR